MLLYAIDKLGICLCWNGQLIGCVTRGREGGREGRGGEGKGGEGRGGEGMGGEGRGREGGREGGRGGREGREGGMEGGRGGRGGRGWRERRDECYTYSNGPQYLNSSYVTYYVITCQSPSYMHYK